MGRSPFYAIDYSERPSTPRLNTIMRLSAHTQAAGAAFIYRRRMIRYFGSRVDAMPMPISSKAHIEARLPVLIQ